VTHLAQMVREMCPSNEKLCDDVHACTQIHENTYIG